MKRGYYSKEMEPVEGLPNTNPVLGIDAPEKATAVPVSSSD